MLPNSPCRAAPLWAVDGKARSDDVAELLDS
jgi:hypothetical protein